MTYSSSNEDDQQKPAIEKFLADLTLEEKQIFLLRYASGFEFQEISDITGIGISAAKMRCKRIVEKLHAIHQLSSNN
jgi:RNA polymerase sigma factor (sigma-70 family)